MCSFLYIQHGKITLSRLQWHYKANLDVAQRKCSVDISFTYSRNNEYRSWCVVKTIQWSYRMEIKSWYFPQSNRLTAEARHRSLCITFKFADETIHFLGTWPRSFSHKCLYSKLVRMANLCLSAFQLAVESAFQVAERRGRRDPDYPQNGRRRCGTPRCWRCWQESLFFFQEGSVLSVYFTRKLLILYTRSYNFWLASSPQITRNKRSSGSDFPSYLGILAPINKTSVCLLPHQMAQVLHSVPVWSPLSTCRYGVAVLEIIWRRLRI